MSIYSRRNPPPGFYIYAYIRSEDSKTSKAGTPYYIGKGRGDRAWKKTKRDKVLPPKDSTNIVVMECKLTEIGSLSLERFYIRWYGRKDNGTGILLNKTDGGDGLSGGTPWNKGKKGIYSEDHLRKISETSKNRVFSKECRERMSRKRKGQKPWNKGIKMRPKTEEDKIKISERRTGIKSPNVECPHCGKIGDVGNMKRWHFDNCKYLTNNTANAIIQN